ncbi:MAG: NAD(P)H-hydrate dehydratase [Cyanobacteria bacterium SIG29]|nr:NAD(P)H-hydrate dehydratase [Cyanobacteria bacterium SIG29]
MRQLGKMAKNLIDFKLVSSFFPERPDNANKGSFLKILNVAGSSLYSGAAFLSSKSALRVGAGYVCLACPNEIISRIAPALPEVTFIPLKSNDFGSISSDNVIENFKSYSVLSVGCGLTTNEDTQNFVINLMKNLSESQKVVIDADAINILALHRNELSLKNSIITPHPKELSRLLNVSLAEIEDNREKYARITSQTYECITILKGHNTIVTDGDKIYTNTTGNSALAKAGTGDVLTGIIAGLLSQKVEPLKAAFLGVFLHGFAGDIASEDYTKYSVLASDLIEYLPIAISELIEQE